MAAEVPVLDRIGDQTDILGESALWSVEDEALYWVDIRLPAIRRWSYASGTTTTWQMPDLVGSIALMRGRRLLVALRDRLEIFHLNDGTLEMLSVLDVPHADIRCNDGRCDRQGRFWFGTMNNVTRGPEGSLYRFDRQSGCKKFFSGIRIPNSLAWSPDGRTMYFADSLTYAIYRYPFDAESGTFGERQLFAQTTAPAIPDGSCVDCDGYLWNAEHGGWRLTRYAPDGRIDRTVELPVEHPTSCAFGGPELDVLYVTTATQRMSDEQLRQQPLAGAVLALRPGVTGLPEPYYLD